MSNPFSVRDPSISHTKVENALLPKEGDDGSNFVLYVDNVNKRLGINVANPGEDLEVDGSIQIVSDNVARLKFNNIGAIGIGGVNFGDAGAVLTSNGSTSPVSWIRPYFMKARVINDYNTSSNTTPILLTEDNLGGNNYNFGDFSVDAWTCPQTGIYRVKTGLTASSQTTDEIQRLVNNTVLQNNTGTTIRVIADASIFLGTEDASEIQEATVSAESIEHINLGEKVKIYPFWVIGAGSGIKILGRDTATRTYMIVQRII